MAFPKVQSATRSHIQYGIDHGFYHDSNGRIKPDVFFSGIADNLFNNEFEWKKERILNASIKNRKIILDRLSQTKDAMSFLSSEAAQKLHRK